MYSRFFNILLFPIFLIGRTLEMFYLKLLEFELEINVYRIAIIYRKLEIFIQNHTKFKKLTLIIKEISIE